MMGWLETGDKEWKKSKTVLGLCLDMINGNV